MKQLTLENLPEEILAEAKEMLKGEDTEVDVIRWNRRIRVVGHVFPYEHSADEKLLLTIYEKDVYTDDERALNYINYYHKYPNWYKGARDGGILERMKQDAIYEFDKKTSTLTCREPYGRMVNGNFVYEGEFKTVVAN